MKMGIQTGKKVLMIQPSLRRDQAQKRLMKRQYKKIPQTKCTNQVTKSVKKTMNSVVSSVRKDFHKPAISKDTLQMFMERVREKPMKCCLLLLPRFLNRCAISVKSLSEIASEETYPKDAQLKK